VWAIAPPQVVDPILDCSAELHIRKFVSPFAENYRSQVVGHTKEFLAGRASGAVHNLKGAPMSVVRFDVGSEIEDLRREVNKIFATMPTLPAVFANGMFGDRFLPAMDTVEKNGKLCLSLDLPGMSEQDIEVEVQGDMLTIRGTREIDREMQNEQWHRHERATGDFERCVQLPQPIQGKSVKASFDKGVLTVTVPLPKPSSLATTKVAVTSPRGKH
jgi:HSP20 family protein